MAHTHARPPDTSQIGVFECGIAHVSPCPFSTSSLIKHFLRRFPFASCKKQTCQNSHDIRTSVRMCNVHMYNVRYLYNFHTHITFRITNALNLFYQNNHPKVDVGFKTLQYIITHTHTHIIIRSHNYS